MTETSQHTIRPTHTVDSNFDQSTVRDYNAFDQRTFDKFFILKQFASIVITTGALNKFIYVVLALLMRVTS